MKTEICMALGIAIVLAGCANTPSIPYWKTRNGSTHLVWLSIAVFNICTLQRLKISLMGPP